LKELPGFQTFIRYNSINDAVLKLAVSNIKTCRFKAGAYIFLQGATTKHFYGILQGSIAIRVRKPTYEKALAIILKAKPKREIRALSINF
jgi:CRP-like cAMP-binding protein